MIRREEKYFNKMGGRAMIPIDFHSGRYLFFFLFKIFFICQKRPLSWVARDPWFKSTMNHSSISPFFRSYSNSALSILSATTKIQTIRLSAAIGPLATAQRWELKVFSPSNIVERQEGNKTRRFFQPDAAQQSIKRQGVDGRFSVRR